MVILSTCLIVLQFAIIATHDLIDIPGWVHGSRVQALLGRRKVWLVTLANSVFPGIAAGFVVYFRNRPAPGFAANYWLNRFSGWSLRVTSDLPPAFAPSAPNLPIGLLHVAGESGGVHERRLRHPPPQSAAQLREFGREPHSNLGS